MVRVVDQGSHFEAPIDKVWKLIEAHQHDMDGVHPGSKNIKQAMEGPNQAVAAWTVEMNGRDTPMKIRVTPLPPLGQAIEVLEGPMAGSKFMNYYTPRGNKTEVTVVGEFASPMIPESQLEGAVRQFLNDAFDQDSAYLRKMK
ncbi:MAG TPA: hypothetical protein VFF67_10740 [Thermoplasmata archaeon]|nr:hypothetical protein [Thermoplasmata archaeon]